MNTYELFLDAWEKATKIPFNVEWKNSTGYLDFLTDADDLDIPAGTFLATTDDYDRRVLIKGMGFKSNIVVFERHSNGTSKVLVNNQPGHRYLKSVGFTNYVGIPDGQLDQRSMEIFLGLRENKFKLNQSNIDYLVKHAPENLSAVALEDFITRGESEGVSEQELVDLGYVYSSLMIYSDTGIDFI